VAGGVICTIDATVDAARVAAAAADIAEQLGLRLVVADGGQCITAERSEAFLEGVAEAAGLHGAELHVGVGNRIQAVLELAASEEAELIVVGRGGEAWRELITRADCPVLVYPGANDRRAETTGDSAKSEEVMTKTRGS
jgi:nucleotide-binding universal stress UspA family protein